VSARKFAEAGSKKKTRKDTFFPRRIWRPAIWCLSSIGVRALKIEGRLKSNAYAFNTAAYYRALLDGDSDTADYYRELSAICFARPQTFGFLQSQKREKLISAQYPSHMGIPGATVLAVQRDKMTIRALTYLSSRDRLFRLPKGPPDEGETLVLVGFLKAKKRTHEISAGNIAEVTAINKVLPGDILMKTLSHDMHLKSLSRGLFPEKKANLVLETALDKGVLSLRTRVLERIVEAKYPVTVEKSRGDKRFEDVLLQLFGESKDKAFYFDRIIHKEGEPPIASDIFIPPSMLKAVRNDFYRQTEQEIEQGFNEVGDIHRLSGFDFKLPKRDEIRYRDDFPFIAEGAIHSASDWPLIDRVRFVSLPPLMFREMETTNAIASEIAAHPEQSFFVGLNNLGHLAVADRWKQFGNVSFYIDYGLYAANVRALLFLINTIERLSGAYLWLEADLEQRKCLVGNITSHIGEMPPGLRFIDEKEHFPMFISRICFHRSTGMDNKCPPQCPKAYAYSLKQNRRLLKVRVRDCVTYVYLTVKRR
jgi:putative protease